MATLNHSTVIKAFEKLSQERNHENFFFDFLKALKFPAATIKRLKEPENNRNVATVAGDTALSKQIYFHPASAGENLQAVLKERIQDTTLLKHKLRFFLTTDFENVVAYDARVDDWASFAFTDLRDNYEFFLPLTGLYEKPLVRTSHPADVKACEKMGKLYDVIRAQNHYEKEHLHDLNVFLTRLLFCFFAEDTGIFPIQGQLTQAIEALTKPNGSDLDEFFERLFWVLDMAPTQPGRKSESAQLAAFPYVNGGLFREKIRIPTFNAKARNILIECGRLEWKEISPVIFGAMFQSVMDPELRHELGAHYTSEKNIFKVIGPLFLDDLKAELDKILEDRSSHRKKRLKDFQAKLASIQIADPACGCGNFLVVSFRELKLLELKVISTLLETDDNKDRSVLTDWQEEYSKVSIDQFYGIEIEEFPVDIARVSLWLMEHVMNQRFGELLGMVIPTIPLRTSAKIVCANALTTDWAEIFPVERLSYLIGNPPFAGTTTTTAGQKNEIKTVFKNRSVGYLDYVACWFEKASELMLKHPEIETAYVATNSVCQGEQVATLWGDLFHHGIHINFAHQTFRWKNEAKENAAVYCVVIGFSTKSKTNKFLFKYKTINSEPNKELVSQINGYLLEDTNTIVYSASKSLSAPKGMVYGNKPSGKAFFMDNEKRKYLISSDPLVEKYIKRFFGAEEFINGKIRYCLWFNGLAEQDIKKHTYWQMVNIANRKRKIRYSKKLHKETTPRLSFLSF